jgi:hypothetical protein
VKKAGSYQYRMKLGVIFLITDKGVLDLIMLWVVLILAAYVGDIFQKLIHALSQEPRSKALFRTMQY